MPSPPAFYPWVRHAELFLELLAEMVVPQLAAVRLAEVVVPLAACFWVLAVGRRLVPQPRRADVRTGSCVGGSGVASNAAGIGMGGGEVCSAA